MTDLQPTRGQYTPGNHQVRCCMLVGVAAVFEAWERIFDIGKIACPNTGLGVCKTRDPCLVRADSDLDLAILRCKVPDNSG